MASRGGSGKKNSTGRGRSGSSSAEKERRSTKPSKSAENEIPEALVTEIGILFLLALCIILILGNFGLTLRFGDVFNSLFFGLFGGMEYVFPFFLFAGVCFYIINKENVAAIIKLISAVVLFFDAGMFLQLFVTEDFALGGYRGTYDYSASNRSGGGLISGGIFEALKKNLGEPAVIVIMILLLVICLLIITGGSIIKALSYPGSELAERARESRIEREKDREVIREERKLYLDEKKAERQRRRELEREEKRQRYREETRKRNRDFMNLSVGDDKEDQGEIDNSFLQNDLFFEEEKEIPDFREPEPEPEVSQGYSPFAMSPEHMIKPKDFDKKIEPKEVPEVRLQESLHRQEFQEELSTSHEIEMNDMHEIIFNDPFTPDYESEVTAPAFEEPPMEELPTLEEMTIEEPVFDEESFEEEPFYEAPVKEESIVKEEPKKSEKKKHSDKPYKIPPLSLLKSAVKRASDSPQSLKETAEKLKDILKSFGVGVKMLNYIQGPTVTRFEMQPEQGVKVNTILNLSNDIQMNLAAKDIRIEAPIPGKAAVGIEIPNKTNENVTLRELVSGDAFKKAASKITIAVGKDIGGETIIYDIDKMPHLLIAGATGSGKSVCINTIIMSILYKAKPDEVKLIMIDPKVVELSIYNGIPHLLTPVVTDPVKAAGALNWGVAEMMKRYKLFAEEQVRNIDGYNEKAEEKLPQIVIIVDELADLMMVQKKDVEASICRLAQLARAAGIHLIIATQRPSVDVITGLIKANMPSRIAFAVSSNVDSRTILDMAGAEKLLGNGDMLFYPQKYPKPERLQGAFVSDEEVQAVTDFVRSQVPSDVEKEDISDEIEAAVNNAPSAGEMGEEGPGGEFEDGRDSYFADAGRFVTEKKKATIGVLQRVFRIGFNRAARIMDQLADAGVVSGEDGTKPRQVLMSKEEFEEYLKKGLEDEE